VEYWLAFVTGFFGGLHCAGMCGPLVLALASRMSRAVPAPRAEAVNARLAYHLGRLFSYLCLGLCAGAAGKAVVGALGGTFWRGAAAGLLLTASGALVFLRLPLPLSGWLRVPARLCSALAAVGSVEAALYVGLCTPLLPCGMLYAVVMQAAAAGDSIRGGAVMAAFALGTIPALALVGAASTAALQRWRPRARWISAAALLFAGVMLFFRSLHAAGAAAAAPH
jgi:sulfite exporter TauE/SafE